MERSELKALLAKILFEGELSSLIPDDRMLFLAMILGANEAGIYEGTIDYAARRGNVGCDDVPGAMSFLQADPAEIEKVEGGWRIVNYEELMNEFCGGK